MSTASDTMPFATLSQTLWRQHRLLELLLYRTEVQRLVLSSGQGRWVEHAASEIDATMDVLREEELVRATQVARVAACLGVDTAASLGELVDASPEPWAEILRDHQRSFLELVDQIEATSKSSRDLLRRSLQLTREMLGLPGEGAPTATYDRSGALPAGRPDPVLLDQDA